LLSLLTGLFAFGKVRFTLARGVAFTFPALAFAFGRFAFNGLFALTFAVLLALAFAFAFSFAFLGFGFFGRFSLLFADAFALRLSPGSSGRTFSGVSPSFAGRLMSMATV